MGGGSELTENKLSPRGFKDRDLSCHHTNTFLLFFLFSFCDREQVGSQGIQRQGSPCHHTTVFLCQFHSDDEKGIKCMKLEENR